MQFCWGCSNIPSPEVNPNSMFYQWTGTLTCQYGNSQSPTGVHGNDIAHMAHYSTVNDICYGASLHRKFFFCCNKYEQLSEILPLLTAYHAGTIILQFFLPCWLLHILQNAGGLIGRWVVIVAGLGMIDVLLLLWGYTTNVCTIKWSVGWTMFSCIYPVLVLPAQELTHQYFLSFFDLW